MQKVWTVHINFCSCDLMNGVVYNLSSSCMIIAQKIGTKKHYHFTHASSEIAKATVDLYAHPDPDAKYTF